MDFALRLFFSVHTITFIHSFNPCFSGFRIATKIIRINPYSYLSFNPCFSGFRIATRVITLIVELSLYVSILVLVDFALRLTNDAEKSMVNEFQSLF